MEKRQNDIFMSMLANPQASFDTIVTVGLTADNTSLQDKSVYANNKYVQEQFKNSDGDFDKTAFDKAYDTAKLYYNNLADANFDESMKRLTVYHRDSLMAPEGQRTSGPMFKEITMANPYEQVFNLTKLGRVDDPTKSADELAQSHKVLVNPTTAGDNLEFAKWEDAPNDNFFGNFFDTLVMALWDENGEHIDPITGEKVKHEKGELKTNQNGEFYYEKLDGRDVYGRRVLNKMNVLTTDGSFWNKYDFFDSDDVLQKSIGGSLMKNLALVGSMFIPYVGPWIAGLSVATLVAGLGATFGKMLVGSDSPTLSAIEGWSKSLNRQTAKTDYAQQNTWCWENFINLIGDVAGLLKEQRFLFEKLPAVFKGTDITAKSQYDKKLDFFKDLYKKRSDEKFESLMKSGKGLEELKKARIELSTDSALKAQGAMDSFVKGYLNLGKVLSMGYMTGITVGDTYGEAKQAGASDLDATLLTLGYAAGEYAILNTGLGEWILPELRADKYKAQAIAKALTSLDSETASLRKQFGAALTNIPKEGKKEYVKRLFNIGKDIANAEYANGTRTLKATLAAGAGEGVEEVSEELLADFSKGCYDVVKWLLGDNTRLNTFGYDFEKGEWNGKDILDRYGMSLVGGAIGGSLTNAFTSYKGFKLLNNMTPQQAILEMVYMARNGGLLDFYKEVDKAQLANPYKSATDFELKGNQILFSPGTETNNQDLFAKLAVKEQGRIIELILEANGANLSDESFLDKQTLGDLRFNALYNSVTAGAYLNEFNSLTSKLVKLLSQLQGAQGSSSDTNLDGTVTDKEKRQNEPTTEDKQLVKNIEALIKETKKQLSDLVEGKRSYDFVATSLFEMTSDLSGMFTTTTFPLFVENKYGKKYSETTENERAIALEEYKTWKETEGRDKIQDLSNVYLKIAQLASGVIKKHADEYLKGDTHILNFNRLILRIYTTIDGDSESEWLSNAQNMLDSTLELVYMDLITLFGSQEDIQKLLAIFDRARSVDPTMTEEERKIEQSLIGNDIKIELTDTLLRGLPNYIQPFIDNGSINSETKQLLLTALNNLAEIVNDKRIDPNLVDEMGRPLPELKIWDQRAEEINKYIQEVEKLGNTSFEKNLNEFSVSIGNEPINITQLLERLNQSFNDVSKNITRFNMDELLYKDLNNAIYTIEMYQAAIKGARTDNAGINNYFGYNATLNEFAKKSGGDYPELAEIDGTTADIFIADINTNLSKLRFLKQLYQINQGQKLVKQDRIAEKKDILLFKRMRSIVSVPKDDPLNRWNGFLDFRNIIESCELHKKYNDTVNLDDKEEFEKESLKIEDAIYDFFQKNQDKLEDPSKLAEFINSRHFQLYTEAREILNEGTESIDDNSLLWWIAGRAAVKSSAFHNRYAQIIDGKLAPVATQELAVYNNYANIVNGNVFTAFTKAFRQSMLSDWKNKSIESRKQILKNINGDELMADDKYVDYALNFLPVPKFSNVVLTEGIAGSGKTSAVYSLTVAMLKKFNPDVLKNVAVVHGASEDSAKKLRDALNIEGSTSYDKAKWMLEIAPTWKEYIIDPKTNLHLIASSDYTFNSENEICSALGITDTTNPPSLVIIDEISKFSVYDLDLINDYAKKYGITVLVAGDFDQTGVIGQHPVAIAGNKLTWHPELSRTSFVRSPKLGVSMRTDNSLKTRNQQKLQAYMQNPVKDIVEFEYFEDETGLYGDKVMSYEYTDPNVEERLLNYQKLMLVDSVIKQVDNLIKTLESNEKIGYIFTDKSSPIYLKLASDEYKNYIDLKEGGSAQGLEGRYYIVEVDPTQGLSSDNDTYKHDATEAYLREIYTGVTRALQGSILIMPTEIGPGIKSKKVSSKLDESVNADVIKNYATKRKELLEKITTAEDIAFNKRNTEGKGVIKPVEKTKEGLNEGISLPPTPVSETTKKTAEVTPDETPVILPSPKVVEFNTIPKEIQEDLLKLLKEVINNPETKEPWDANDTNSLYHYGQIVYSQGEYGVIKGIQLKSDGNHNYLIETLNGNKEINYKLIDLFVSNSELISPVVLDHQEMVNRFGDIANVESITVNYNGIDLTLPLCQIPFKNPKGETGTNNMINYFKRNIVVIKIGNVHIPFYMSTGSGGKKNVLPGLWYPFFGIKGSWLNKGSEEEINNFYGSPILKTIAEQLNQVLGTGYVDEIRGPMTTDEETLLLDYINLDLNPTENHKSDTIDKFNSNVLTTLEAIDKSLSEIVPEITEVKADTLFYEDDQAPVNFKTDVIDDLEYQEAVDKENERETLPTSEAIKTGSEIHLRMLLHSFNTFETGVLWDEQGNPIPVGGQEWADKRIDSVNGLLKLPKFLGLKKDNYLTTLGLLRSSLFNIEDKAELAKELEKLLDLKGIYITFALKSSPRPGEGNKAEGREFVEETPTPFSKGISETTEFNGSSDTRSHEWHSKSLVAIIGTETNGDVLEIPLLALSSPYTLMQIKDGNGAYVYPDLYKSFVNLKEQGLNYYDIANQLIRDFENVKEYTGIIDLFKLFVHTDRNIQFIRDTTWTPAKNLSLQGAVFAKNRGLYQGLPGFDYDSDSIPEEEWTTLDEMYKDTQRNITQQVFTVLNAENNIVVVNNKEVQYAKPGHAFVLASYDKKLNTDKAIVDYYKKQCENPDLPRKVTQIYIIPPKASIQEYAENLRKILDKDPDAYAIGQFFTSFKLLKILLQNETFRELFDLRTPGLLQKVENYINSIQLKLDIAELATSVSERIDAMTEVKNALYEADNWSDITGGSTKPVKIAGLLDAALVNFIYDRNSISSLVTENWGVSTKLNEDNLKLVEGILAQANITGVYHNIKVPQNASTVSGFKVVGSNHTLNGKPFRVHNKLDSYTFLGDIGQLVHEYVNGLRASKPNKNGEIHYAGSDTYLYLKGKSNINSKHLSKNEIEKTNLENTLKKKGIDLNKLLSDNNLLEYYENSLISDSINKIVDLINQTIPNKIAFKVNGKLIISDNVPTLGTQVFITDQNNNPINDLTPLLNNFGVALFNITTNNINYKAIYNEKDRQIELVPSIEENNQSPQAQLSINEDNFVDYIANGREALKDWMSDFEDAKYPDEDLTELFNAESIEEFWNIVDHLPKPFDDDIKLFVDYTNEEEFKLLDEAKQKIVNEIIALEQAVQNRKYNETQEACPLSIIFKV